MSRVTTERPATCFECGRPIEDAEYMGIGHARPAGDVHLYACPCGAFNMRKLTDEEFQVRADAILARRQARREGRPSQDTPYCAICGYKRPHSEASPKERERMEQLHSEHRQGAALGFNPLTGAELPQPMLSLDERERLALTALPTLKGMEQ